MTQPKKQTKTKKQVDSPKEFIPDAFAIRTSRADGSSYGGFMWPKAIDAIVEAPDWLPTDECGNGLHGLLDGVGAWGYLNSAHDSLWWIVGVKRDECIVLDGDKVKFPRCKVIYFGGINGALTSIAKEWRRVALEAATKVENESTSTAGDWAHASTAGDWAHASTAGDWAHASTAGSSAHASTAGSRAHASTAGSSAHASTAGSRAHASTAGSSAHASTAGVEAHASTAGVEAHASTAGVEAHASTAGDWAHASTAGDWAHASTAGDWAHASTAGVEAHASTAGDKSISSGLGYKSQAKAAEGGAICLVNRDDNGNIVAIRASKVGENGIKPNIFYLLDADANFIEVSE